MPTRDDSSQVTTSSSLRLKLRFRTHEAASGSAAPSLADRVFVDQIDAAEFADLQDVYNIIDRKLPVLGLSQHAYTLLRLDPALGDEPVVVDDRYWSMSVDDVVSRHRRGEDRSGGSTPLLELVVEVGESLTSEAKADRGEGVGVVSLASLRQLQTVGGGGGPSLRSAPPQPSSELAVSDLVASPTTLRYHVVAVVLRVRAKRPPVVEVELCDVTNNQSRITAVSFDAGVSQHLASLRGNGTEVVEVQNPTVVRKSERDRQYEHNTHPMYLKLTLQSSIRVRFLLPHSVETTAPVVAAGGSGADSTAAGIASLGYSAASTRALHGADLRTSAAALPAPPSRTPCPSGEAASLLTATTVSTGSGTTKTLFRLSCTPSISAPSSSSSVIGSSSGSAASTSATVQPYTERGVQSVGLTEVHARDVALERAERMIEAKKQRVHDKKRVSTKCLLCGFDSESMSASMEALRTTLRQNRCCPSEVVGTLTPTQVLQALSDRRHSYRRGAEGATTTGSSGGSGGEKSPTVPRFYCKTRFVDLHSGTSHVVHPRCVHLCDAYQKGRMSMEDVALMKETHTCALCRTPGATVACYHPECNEEYHVLCAIFSNGYVNFGRRDPLLPVPACPRHTEVKCTLDAAVAEREIRWDRSDGSLRDVVPNRAAGTWTAASANPNTLQSASKKRGRGSSELDEQDGVLFDSAVVHSGDLRDPDEEQV